jgi:hypothetical protein
MALDFTPEAPEIISKFPSPFPRLNSRLSGVEFRIGEKEKF